LFEHLQTGNCNSLRPPIDSAIFERLVAPSITSTSVEQHADEEEIDHAFAPLCVVHVFGESREEVGNAVAPTHCEVLVAAVRRDAREGCIVVSLNPKVLAPSMSKRLLSTCLDDICNKRHHVRELVHVDIEVPQLVLQGLVCDDLGALTDGTQAP
jgi:hypothetical protein